MGKTEAAPSQTEAASVAAAARAGDESAFAALVERYRRELQVHCYRMLGSLEDAEDLVQETFLRAWRKRDSFQGRSTFRAWLYRIATNACLDALERRPRPAASGADATPAEVPWLQAYPDRLLEGIAPKGDEPESVVVAKETIEIAFLVAIQHLPPRQRAVLILRDVLGWSAKETAALLEGSVAAVNSALQRARTGLKEHLPPHRSEWATGEEASEQERALLRRYMDAHEEGDAGGLVELIREDGRFTMPPEPVFIVGSRPMVAFWVAGGFGSDSFGHMRCVPARANRQPAVAIYLRRPGDSKYRPLSLDVLRIEEGAVAEVTTFALESPEAFGLPPSL
jgi:RNA polymerase sigma-70 factor, ECF subfamily